MTIPRYVFVRARNFVGLLMKCDFPLQEDSIINFTPDNDSQLVWQVKNIFSSGPQEFCFILLLSFD